VGLIIGLPILGWGLWPVKWTDAAPQHLREDLKEDYLRMAIQSYSVQPDPEKAVARWKELGEDAPAILEKLRNDPSLSAEALIKFSAIIQQSEVGMTEQVSPQPTKKGQAGATVTAKGTLVPTQVGTPGSVLILPTTQATEEAQKEGGVPFYIILLGVFCVLMLIIGAVLVYLLVLRKRPSEIPPLEEEEVTSSQVEHPDIEARAQEEPPVAQFMTTYMLGDDLYDDSFTIDAPNGEFLGECGVGISDTIGVGDPKKVTAFEVWVFDKDDIQTVTKVLMSEYAFNDQSIRQRLASKGEPVEIHPDERMILETVHLKLVARVVDFTYGQGPLPENSFFDRLTLELAVWRK